MKRLYVLVHCQASGHYGDSLSCYIVGYLTQEEKNYFIKKYSDRYDDYFNCYYGNDLFKKLQLSKGKGYGYNFKKLDEDMFNIVADHEHINLIDYEKLGSFK